MVAKRKSKTRKETSAPFNGRDLKANGKGVPLRSQAEEALQSYFEALNGHKPTADPTTLVNISIKAGYVIDLTDEPPAKVVDVTPARR